jgi:hypothetical protein
MFNVHISTFDKAAFLETLEERFQAHAGIGRSGIQMANHGDRRLLRSRHDRPGQRTANPCVEFASSHLQCQNWRL